MRIPSSQRVVLSLVTGLLTLAIVVGVAFSYNHLTTHRDTQLTPTPTQTTIAYTVTTTPSSSAPAHTPTPTSGNGAHGATTTSNTTTSASGPTTHGGRASSSAPIASATPTPVPTASGGSSSASPTATPTSASPTATPTVPSVTYTPGDGSTVTGPFTTTSAYEDGGWLSIPITMENTGTTTWLGDWSYYLACKSTCTSANNSPTNNTVSGATESFTATLYAPYAFTTGTFYSTWSMVHSGTAFGALATIKIVATAAKPLGVDPAPGCDSSSMSWSLSGGSACANGGLTLTTNSAQEPAAYLQRAPAGFNDANYYVTVHASFSSVTNAWVRLMGYYPIGSRCGGQGFDVQPNGTWRTVTIVNCKENDGAWNAGTLGGSSVTLTLWLGSGYFDEFINYGGRENGGSLFTSGYPAISVGGNDGVAVTVTNAELDTPITPVTQGTLMP